MATTVKADAHVGHATLTRAIRAMFPPTSGPRTPCWPPPPATIDPTR